MYLSILHHGLLPTGQTPHGLLLNVRPNNSLASALIPLFSCDSLTQVQKRSMLLTHCTGPRVPVPKCNYPHWSSISDPSLTS